MTALNWLNDLTLWLARLVPRWFIVRCTHRVIKFSRGGYYTECTPGIWWYWPAITELVYVQVTERTSLTSAQVIKNRFLAYSIVWRVINAQRTAIQYRNIEARLETEVRISAVTHNGEESEIIEQVSNTFKGVVEIISLRASTDTTGFVLKQFTDSATRDKYGL